MNYSTRIEIENLKTNPSRHQRNQALKSLVLGINPDDFHTEELGNGWRLTLDNLELLINEDSTLAAYYHNRLVAAA